jgi:hypothetical protein
VPEEVEPRVARLVHTPNIQPPPAGSVLETAMPFDVRLAPDVSRREDAMRKAHHVPLSGQAVELFRQVRTVTGPARFRVPLGSHPRPTHETKHDPSQTAAQ